MPNTQKNFYKKLFGLKGELKAVDFLKANGFNIIEKNYKTKFGEADVICEQNGELYFVEVKTRSNTDYGTPADAVNYKKQEKYKKIALYYLTVNNLQNVNVNFSVIEILNGNINFIKEAF